MFFSFDLLNPRLPVGQIWLAAHRKLKSKNEYLMAVEGLQDGIKNVLETRLDGREAEEHGGVPHALRSASVLMFGCVVVYGKKVQYLKDDSAHALTSIQQTSKAAAVDLPASAPAHVNAVTLPPPSEVEYDNLAYFANASAKAFRFVREDGPSAITTLLPDPFEGAFAHAGHDSDEDFFGMVEASSSRSGRTPEAFRDRSESDGAPERFRAAGDPEQPNWNADLLASPFGNPVGNDDYGMDFGPPPGGDLDLELPAREADQLSAGPGLERAGFTPGSIGGDSLPGADLPAQDATIKTPQSAKGKKSATAKEKEKGASAEKGAGATPGKGVLKQATKAKPRTPNGAKKRKVIIDADVILRNRDIAAHLADPGPTLADPELLPGTAAEALVARLRAGSGLLEVATRPMIASSCLDVPLSAIHPALQKLYRSRIGAASAVVNGTEGAAAEAGKAGAAADEEEEEDAGAAGPSAGKKRKRGSQEGAAQLQELQGQAGGDGGGPGPGPADNFFDEGYAPENIGFDDNMAGGAFGEGQSQPSTGPRKRKGKEAAGAESEGADADDSLQFLNRLDVADSQTRQENTHTATQDQHGWSKRSKYMLGYLLRRFREEGAVEVTPGGTARAEAGLKLSSCVAKKNRLQASIVFFELLVLQNKNYVKLNQQVPFGEVIIFPGPASLAELAAA